MKKILIYRFSAFGDVAMLAPVLREFLEQNTDTEIVFVSRKQFKPLFEDIDGVVFHGVNVDDYNGVFGLVRLGKELYEQYSPDLVGDLHNIIRAKVLNLYFKQKGFHIFKIDKGKAEKKSLTDVHNFDKHQLKKTVERYADVLRAMGFPLTLSHQLRPLSVDRMGIGFAPFAKHAGKMLPLEKSYQVAVQLAKKHPVYFFGGGKSEVDILNRWESEIENTQSLAGKLTLKEELQRIAGLKLMITMDSANMHLASLMGTRVVSIWGATHPYAGFLGYGQSIDDCIQINDLTCRPCSVYGNKPCFRGDYACLNEITIGQILRKVTAVLLP